MCLIRKLVQISCPFNQKSIETMSMKWKKSNQKTPKNFMSTNEKVQNFLIHQPIEFTTWKRLN